MTTVEEGSLLWTPSPDVIANANLTRYMAWLASHYGQSFADFRELWRWSTTELEQFWQSVWEFCDVRASNSSDVVLRNRTMPGAEWFPGARLNYAENIFHKMRNEGPVLIYESESGDRTTYDRDELYRQTSALRQALQSLGVGQGDRVVAYMPNVPEAIVGLLAATSLGAIWSSCSPDFGARAVLDRFSQIEPKVLIACDGYMYNGKPFSRLDVVREMQAALPTLEKTILVPTLANVSSIELPPNTLLWHETLATGDFRAPLHFEQVPFDHPLWVLYSSGTTGLPKPIVHGHGGILLEHMKELTFHMDLRSSDRFFWYTSTGWMMWNYLVGALLTGASILLYDGSPGYPDLNRLWQLASETGITYFGTSAAFIHTCMQQGIDPAGKYDLSNIRALGSTGSPLSPAGFRWVYDHVNSDLALESFSGGTDLCTGFVGGVRLLPVYAGELQHPSLGASVHAYDKAGNPVVDEVGELVITEPMPSMPLYFWNDPGNERYLSSYFDVYPGVWRHGDWIKINERGGCVIYGRSDATINRQGVRMGTAEIYHVLESVSGILDSLVIDLEGLEGESYLPLFVVLDEGVSLDEALRSRIRQHLRNALSPRHVPDEIIAVPDIPYTLSGKKMELPVKRVLEGIALEEAANRGAMRNPGAIDFFASFATERATGKGTATS